MKFLKDEDFAVLATLVNEPAAVVWLRLGNATNSMLRNWLGPLFPQIVQRLAAADLASERRESLSFSEYSPTGTGKSESVSPK